MCAGNIISLMNAIIPEVFRRGSKSVDGMTVAECNLVIAMLLNLVKDLDIAASVNGQLRLNKSFNAKLR